MEWVFLNLLSNWVKIKKIEAYVYLVMFNKYPTTGSLPVFWSLVKYYPIQNRCSFEEIQKLLTDCHSLHVFKNVVVNSWTFLSFFWWCLDSTFLFNYFLVVVSNDRKFTYVCYWGTSVFLDYGKVHRRRNQSRYQRNSFRIAKNTFIIKFTFKINYNYSVC